MKAKLTTLDKPIESIRVTLKTVPVIGEQIQTWKGVFLVKMICCASYQSKSGKKYDIYELLGVWL